MKEEPDAPIELWQNLSAIYRTALKRLNSRLSEEKLSFPQYSILRAVGKFGPMQMNKLGEHMLVAPANVTGLVDRLEKKGYVRRAKDARDRRLFKIELTDKGVKLYGAISQQFRGYVRKLFESLPGDERVALLSTLRRVRDRVEALASL